jgi:hypothetical protein
LSRNDLLPAFETLTPAVQILDKTVALQAVGDAIVGDGFDGIGFLPMNSLLGLLNETLYVDIQPQIESLSQRWPRIPPTWSQPVWRPLLDLV